MRWLKVLHVCGPWAPKAPWDGKQQGDASRGTHVNGPREADADTTGWVWVGSLSSDLESPSVVKRAFLKFPGDVGKQDRTRLEDQKSWGMCGTAEERMRQMEDTKPRVVLNEGCSRSGPRGRPRPRAGAGCKLGFWGQSGQVSPPTPGPHQAPRSPGIRFQEGVTRAGTWTRKLGQWGCKHPENQKPVHLSRYSIP